MRSLCPFMTAETSPFNLVIDDFLFIYIHIDDLKTQEHFVVSAPAKDSGM